MIIPTKIKPYYVSMIKKGNKISLCIFKDNEMVKPDSESGFPFNCPLITKDSVKVFEFLIEANNYVDKLSNK